MGKERTAFSAADKVRMVKYAEEHSFRAASSHFGVPEANIRQWQKRKEALEKLPGWMLRKRRGGATNPEQHGKKNEQLGM